MVSQKTTSISQKPSGTSQRPSNLQLGTSSKPLKDMTSFEWAFNYQEESRTLLLSLGKTDGPGVLKGGHVFSYGKVRRVDYQDEETANYIVSVETSKGERVLLLSESNLVLASCKPLELRHILSESENIIIALQPFISGHASFAESVEATSEEEEVEVVHKEPLVPVMQNKAKKRKQRVQSKPIKKARKEDSSASESEEPDALSDKEIVTPGAELSSGIIDSKQNTIRRQIIKSKLLRRGHIFTLPITLINRPPIDPETGRRPLEIREPHNLHVQNLKKKMKINPHATVVPFLVMVDPSQCPSINDFDISNPEKYQYFVIGGSHSAEARRQLVMEHPTTYFFKYAECKIYVGLTVEEAKLLVWDHNNDNDYRQKMSSIERIRLFHYEYLDSIRQFGPRLHPCLRRHCLNEVGIVVDDTVKSDGLRKYES